MYNFDIKIVIIYIGLLFKKGLFYKLHGNLLNSNLGKTIPKLSCACGASNTPAIASVILDTSKSDYISFSKITKSTGATFDYVQFKDSSGQEISSFRTLVSDTQKINVSDYDEVQVEIKITNGTALRDGAAVYDLQW